MKPHRKRRARDAYPPLKQNEGSDELAFLWAVSYSDLLMVILSFFVVFFSMTDGGQKDIIKTILDSLKDKVPAIQAKEQSKVTTLATGGQGAAEQAAPQEKAKSLAEELQAKLGKRFEVIKDPDSKMIVINFPDNLYGSGAYKVEDQIKKEMDQVLALLESYKEQVHLTVIGHADQKPIRPRPGNFISSNLVLSNLRASEAVNYVGEAGFNKQFLSTEGYAEFGRGTRTISLKIKEREGAAKP